MIRKTALFAGIAGLMMTAAPAFAQDATPPAQEQAAPAQPGTLSLQPGADVKGSDGTVLGKLEGVQNNAAGEQELTVRGADGQLKGVPLGGLKPEGTGVAVAWSSTQFQSAPAITEPAAPAAPETAVPEPAAEPATPPST